MLRRVGPILPGENLTVSFVVDVARDLWLINLTHHKARILPPPQFRGTGACVWTRGHAGVRDRAHSVTTGLARLLSLLCDLRWSSLETSPLWSEARAMRFSSKGCSLWCEGDEEAAHRTMPLPCNASSSFTDIHDTGHAQPASHASRKTAVGAQRRL